MLAVAGAVLLSPLFPIAVARRADPSIGIHADWLVLGLGAVTIAVVVLVIAFVAAYRATAPAASRRRDLARKSSVAERAAHVGLPPTITNGLRMTFEPGRGRTAVPVRSALLGAVIGVVGVSATLVFASSLDHLVATPRLSGSTWDFKVAEVFSNDPCGGNDFGLTKQPGIAALAEVCTQNVQIDSRPAVAVAYTHLHGEAIDPEIIAGRAPHGPRGDHARNEDAAGAR